MAKTVEFSVYTQTGARVGTLEHEAFWSVSQKRANEILLDAILDEFPALEASVLTMGATSDVQKATRRYGGDVYVGDASPALKRGQQAAKDDGKERVISSRKAVPVHVPTRDERAIAWLMDGRMSLSLDEAYATIDAQIQAEQEAARAEQREAIAERISAGAAKLSTLMGQFAQICELYTSIGGELDDNTLALFGVCVSTPDDDVLDTAGALALLVEQLGADTVDAALSGK